MARYEKARGEMGGGGGPYHAKDSKKNLSICHVIDIMSQPLLYPYSLRVPSVMWQIGFSFSTCK